MPSRLKNETYTHFLGFLRRCINIIDGFRHYHFKSMILVKDLSSPGVVRVLTWQNFANSGVLSPDFETFIVAAETYVLFRLLNILWGQFYLHGTNSQLYSKILCYDIV